MPTRSYDVSKDTVELFDDQLTTPADYAWWTAHAKSVGKPITTRRRPEPKPPNALVVTKSELEDHQNYLALTARARREGKVISVVEDPPDPTHFLVVQKRDVPDPESYERRKAQAAEEGRELWVVDDE